MSTLKPVAQGTQPPRLTQLFLALLLAAASGYSALRAYETPLSEGPTKWQVWWYGWITALSTGLGAFPMLFVQGAREPRSRAWDVRTGLAPALAAPPAQQTKGGR